jgi:hypothetical protein
MNLPKRLLGTSILAMGMIVSQAVAAADGGTKKDSTIAPLAAGKPAGVKQAQEAYNIFPIVVGGVLLAAGIVLVIVGDNPPATATTPATATSTGTA